VGVLAGSPSFNRILLHRRHEYTGYNPTALPEADAMVALRSLHSLVESDRRTIDEIATSLPAGWPVDAIVLYGSKARGDDTPDSDIDLLVLTSRPLTPEETGRMREFVRRVGLRLGTWPEIYVRTSDEWWHGVYQAAPIRKEIDAEGIDVFRLASGGRT
jgi:predicted nucleotidyltransferase